MSDVKSLFRKKTKQAVRTYPIEGRRGEGGWSGTADGALCVKCEASASSSVALSSRYTCHHCSHRPFSASPPNPTLHLSTGQGQGRARQAVSICPLVLSLLLLSPSRLPFPSPPSIVLLTHTHTHTHTHFYSLLRSGRPKRRKTTSGG
jgi:hypothetical protein